MSRIEYLDLNIALLPDLKTSQKLIEWSQIITRKYPSDYVLDDYHLPHLSLYSARYPAKNQDLITQNIDQLCQQISSFPITLPSFSLFSGFLFYDAVKEKHLLDLHEMVVDKLNLLREGLISDNQKQQYGLSPEQQQAIKDYGYVSVKKLYMPHISLTHLQNPPQENTLVFNSLPQEQNTFFVRKLVIAPYGDFGTLSRPLKTYLIK